MGLSWRTVRKYATATGRQECVRRRPQVRPPLDRYLEYPQQRPPHRTLDTAERLQRLLAHCPELNRAHVRVRAFAARFDSGHPGALPDWLNQLETSRLPGLPTLLKSRQ